MGYQPPYNEGLCVLPGPPDKKGERESQYEAFLSIYSGTMAGDLYKNLCDKNGIILHELNTTPGIPKEKLEKKKINEINNNPQYLNGSSHIIVFVQKITHYKAYVKGEKLYDPYHYWQSPNTHGFCQTFAFYLALKYGTNPNRVTIPTFQDIPTATLDNQVSIFNAYVCNTAKCGIAIMQYIKKHTDIKAVLTNNLIMN